MLKFSACGGLYAYCKGMKREWFILEGRSPPQAENFAIWGPLNADFQWENEPPEAKIWSKSGPEVKEPPPSLRTKPTRRGGVLC